MQPWQESKAPATGVSPQESRDFTAVFIAVFSATWNGAQQMFLNGGHRKTHFKDQINKNSKIIFWGTKREF